MASLKEIKGRIASVKSTLKITSAMKMVASSKLRRAQGAIAGMLPYQKALGGILSDLITPGSADPRYYTALPEDKPLKVALVCISSNSSLCGAFNSNVARRVTQIVATHKQKGDIVEVFPVGKKISDAMKKAGFSGFADYTLLAGKPSYDGAAALAQLLVDGYLQGRYDKVELVYNHFKSSASQVVTNEAFLPMELPAAKESVDKDLIIEPSREEQVALLLPKVLKLKIFTVLLDSVAAEHAARTVAMQIATDNAQTLLGELSLEYNKGRQQKITNEILDLEGGSMEE